MPPKPSQPRGSMNAAQAILGPPLAAGLARSPALLFRGQRWSYGRLAAQVNRLGNGLRALQVRPGQRVLLLLPDTPELVCLYLAILKIGAVAVTVNPSSSAHELRFALRHARPAAVAVHGPWLRLLASALRGLRPRPVLIQGGTAARGLTVARLAQGRSPRLDAEPRSPQDMAFWIYTSGTTGAPKAVVHLQQDVLLAPRYLRETLGVARGQRLFATSKLFFAYALGTCLLGSLQLGATTVLDDRWPTPSTVRDVLRRTRPQVVFSVPFLYRSLLRSGTAASPSFRAVRHWVSAGERLPEPVFHAWRQATGQDIVEGLGTSETLFMALSNRPGECRAGSAGRAAPGAQVRLRDARGRPIARARQRGGQPGELWVRIASTRGGYWEPLSGAPGGLRRGWFATGDRFRRDAQGYWFHLGREEDVLRLGRRRVHPGEMESAVLALPGIADAALVAVPSARGAEAVLFAVAAPGVPRALAEQRLRRAIPPRLAAMGLPHRVQWLRELPRTASGKVQRYRLRARGPAGGTRGSSPQRRPARSSR